MRLASSISGEFTGRDGDPRQIITSFRSAQNKKRCDSVKAASSVGWKVKPYAAAADGPARLDAMCSTTQRERQALSRLQPAVDGVLVAAVDGERGLEGFLRDFPDGFVVGVGVAVGHEQAVQELEQVPRHAERAEGVDQPLVGDRVVEQRCGASAAGRSTPQLRMRALARS